MLRVGLHNGRLNTVAEHVERLNATKAISQQDGMMIVETHQAQEALLGILEITNRLDAQITSLEVFEPNLETVFLQLTGKSLRD